MNSKSVTSCHAFKGFILTSIPSLRSFRVHATISGLFRINRNGKTWQ